MAGDGTQTPPTPPPATLGEGEDRVPAAPTLASVPPPQAVGRPASRTRRATDGEAADFHAPFLRRLRNAGHDPIAFRGRRTRAWLAAGITMLAVLAVAPFLWPELAPTGQRLGALVGLGFLLSALGLWFGMEGRAFSVAFALVFGLYGLTAWTPLVTQHTSLTLSDLFAVAFLLGFGLFALAGFNLVFVLEEVVYDAHQHLHLRHRAWSAIPAVAMLSLSILLPTWAANGGPRLDATFSVAVAATVLLALWWLLGLLVRDRMLPILRELHLLVMGATAAAFLADAALWLRRSTSLLPSAVAYLALLGTWVYVSYTTLQRTHFLLRGRNSLPWVCILLAASLSVISHVQALYLSSGSPAVDDLVESRAEYLVAGVWIGLAFLVLRGLARAFRMIAGEAAIGPAGQRAAGRAAGVADQILATRRAAGAMAFSVLRRVDRALPGRRAGWELDSESLALKPMDDE